MGKFLGKLFGGSPKTSSAATQSTQEAKKKAKKSKAQLLSTQGGVAGQELEVGQVGGTDDIFGN